MADLIGKRFGKLLVLDRIGTKWGQKYYSVLCDCGKKKNMAHQPLTASNSCGCTKIGKQTHGMTKTSIYRVYKAMVNRCERKNVKSYEYYGGRDIKVCDQWHKFENFYADMGARPEGGTLERINNDGNYEPSNVRWATKKEQANNKRNNRIYVSDDGTEKNMSQWAKELGISPSGLQARIRRGMMQGEAINRPAPKNLKKPNAQFSDDDIREIRSLFLTTSSTKLGEIYKVSSTSILNIVKRKTYQDIL